MTLAEKYACECGVPLGEPSMADAFYPLDHPLDRAILIHAFAGATVQQGNTIQAQFPAKIYDHFSEVVALLKPMAEAAGFQLYQIGGPNEPQLAGVQSLVGKTTYHQCAYLVKGCAALIGCDSMWAHVRGAERKPQVHIYGSTSKPHFPYWRDASKAILIEAHRGGKRPTYSSHETPKTVSQIPPEQITNAALSILGLTPATTRQSLFVGDAYHQHVVELVPNVVIAPQVQVPGALIIRMDLAAPDDATAHDRLAANLQVRPCAIITDRDLNLNHLAQLKPRIAGLRVEVDRISADWIKAAKRLGLPIAFFSSERDPEALARRRLDLYDACLFDHYVPSSREDFLKGVRTYTNREVDIDSSMDTLMFKTNRFLLSEGKVYLSESHWRAGRPAASSDQNSDRVIDDATFWEGAAHIYAFTP